MDRRLKVKKCHFIEAHQNDMLAEIYNRFGIKESEFMRRAIKFYAMENFRAIYSEFENQNQTS